MHVTPTPPASPATRPNQNGTTSRETPPPRLSASDSGTRPNESPRPNASASGIRPNDERVFRAHDHQPTLSADAIVASQREQTDRLDKLIEQLSRVVSSTNGPSAAIGSPAAPTDGREADLDRVIRREIELGKLERTMHPNGHVTYRLPLNSVRNLGYELVGKRDAFVDRGGHLEIAGNSADHLRVAALHAARKWGSEPVAIYADGKHLDALIEHAVRAGLNVANEHPTIKAKVAAERNRQATSLGHERSTSATRQHDVAPVIARVR